MTDEEYKANMQKFEIERCKREAETKRILFDKLKEMSEIKFEDCAYNCGNNEYAITCSAMGEIAKIILDIT